MPRTKSGFVYIGIKGHVLALDRKTGTEIWRTPLKTDYGRTTSFVNLHRDRDYLYAAVQGEVFCLDPKNGTLLWHNPLKGLGFGVTSVLSEQVAAGGDENRPAASVAELLRQEKDVVAGA